MVGSIKDADEISRERWREKLGKDTSVVWKIKIIEVESQKTYLRLWDHLLRPAPRVQHQNSTTSRSHSELYSFSLSSIRKGTGILAAVGSPVLKLRSRLTVPIRMALMKEDGMIDFSDFSDSFSSFS